ncbi:hypothetical protein GJAV_G00190890 [Gymnothorax javanicus]|nr:hypothetical protein GJAV_G00190890 [Gymnothorax javanicus]
MRPQGALRHAPECEKEERDEDPARLLEQKNQLIRCAECDTGAEIIMSQQMTRSSGAESASVWEKFA